MCNPEQQNSHVTVPRKEDLVNLVLQYAYNYYYIIIIINVKINVAFRPKTARTQ